MNVEELITERYMWLEYGEDFLIEALFSSDNEKISHFVECAIVYVPESKSWNYHFKWNDNVNFPEDKMEEMRQRVGEFTERGRQKAEEKADEIFSFIDLTRDYEISPEDNLSIRRKVFVNGVTVGKRKVDFTWFLFDNKKIEITFLDEQSDKELFKDINFVFTMEFAEKHLKGFKEFKDYLLTKSKDRLLFMF